eukprot:gene28977-38331_t
MKKYDHSHDAANKAFDHNSFLLLAMYDIYSCKLEDDDPDVNSFLKCEDTNMKEYGGKLFRVENKLAKKSGRNFLSICRSIEAVKRQQFRCLNWKCNVEVLSDSTINCTFSAPLVAASGAYTRTFGDHRFLFVTITLSKEGGKCERGSIFASQQKKNICSICEKSIAVGEMVFGTKPPPPEPWKIQCLDCKDDNLTRIRKGIEFAGSKYQFLGGELNNDYSKLDCWFFSTSFITRNGTTMALPYTVSEARNWLADFDSVESPFKINARLKLGFSPTRPCFDLTDQDIILDDDIISDSGGSSGIMTDGCGLIHSSLAKKIPYAISS